MYLPIELIRYVLKFNQEWMLFCDNHFIDIRKLAYLPRPKPSVLSSHTIAFTVDLLHMDKIFSLAYYKNRFAELTLVPKSREIISYYVSYDREKWTTDDSILPLVNANLAIY